MAQVIDERGEGLARGGFTLGEPALVCRWRLAGRGLPLENRHLRALGQRVVNGGTLSPQLVAWAKQHIEWTLAEGAAAYPEGVLMIIVDGQGQAAMTVGPYEPLARTDLTSLATRARAGAFEASGTGVAPETLWLVRDGSFLVGMEADERPGGSCSLMLDLARTCGFAVERRGGLADEVLLGEQACDEALLVSDEHGIVAASNRSGERSRRFVEGYQRLLGQRRR